MKRIGIRTLKAEASGIVRNVAESKVSYVITNHGRAMGVLSPIRDSMDEPRPTEEEAWRNVFELARRVDKRAVHRKSSVRELSAMRR